MKEILLAVSTIGDVYVSIAGRRECTIRFEDVFWPVVADVEGREKRDRSSIKFPAARLEGVRGISSFTATSYAC
jgi:hypothetical protein